MYPCDPDFFYVNLALCKWDHDILRVKCLAVLLVCEFVEFFFINFMHIGTVFTLVIMLTRKSFAFNSEVCLLTIIYIYILWKPPLERLLQSIDIKMIGCMMLNKYNIMLKLSVRHAQEWCGIKRWFSFYPLPPSWP